MTLLPEFLRTLREWLELLPVAWTNFYPMNRVYDALHNFLDFENAKRLIVYGIILIIMMIIRPDGLLTRDSLRRLPFCNGRPVMLEAAAMADCLEIKGLTKRFGGFFALNDLDMEVKTGHIHALIGPNGAGKTTFFNLVTGVLPADAGTIVFEGAGDERCRVPRNARSRGLRAPSRTSACSRI